MGNAERHLPYVLKTINARLKQAEVQVGRLVLDPAETGTQVAAIQTMAADLRAARDTLVAGPVSEGAVMEAVEALRTSQKDFRALVPVTARGGGGPKGPAQTVEPESLEVSVGFSGQ